MILYEDKGQRRTALAGVRRVVLKVGTRLLTSVEGTSKSERVGALVEQIAALRELGLDLILVSSGAIGAGMSILETKRRPTSLPQLQAHAAVGQSRLMYLYESACTRYGFHCAQLLLTAADLQERERHLNVTCCLDALLSRRILPVVNENDSVSVEEIKFGDNDILAALTAAMMRADLTVLLTTVDGLHEPGEQGWGRRVSVVSRLTPQVQSMAGGTDRSDLSVGGMASKLRAAELLSKSGESLWVVDGRDFGVLQRVFAGEDVGTLFVAGSAGRMAARKRYLAFFSGNAGAVVVDTGAARALVEQGRSLLPIGIVAVEGAFERGETLRVLSEDGVEIARGTTNYSSDDVTRVRGRRTADLRQVLGHDAYDEVIHRDHLVLTSETSEATQGPSYGDD